MKKTLRALGIIAIMAVIGLAFTTCQDPEPEPPSPVITINSHPAATTNVMAGSISGVLSVSANVTQGAAISYQWFRNTTNSNTSGAAISGATIASLTIPTDLLTGTHYFFVEVRASGAEFVRSNVATVIVAAPAPVIIITTHPAPTTTVTEGSISGNLTVAASVTHEGTPSFQWFRNETVSNDGGTAISGATEVSFTIPTGLTVGTHYFFVEVKASGVEPARSNVATVNVVPAPVIIISAHPALTTNVTAGSIIGSLSVTASVTQSAELSYQWFRNETDSNVGGNEIDGATGASFAIPTDLTAGAHYFFVEVRASGAESVRSNVATVNVAAPAPVITITTPPAPTTRVTAGSITGNLIVTASVTQGAALNYQWFSNITNSNDGGNEIPGATGASFTIPTNLTEEIHFFFVEVRANGADSVRSNVAVIDVLPSPGIPIAMSMERLQAGTFWMGSSDDPEHTVFDPQSYSWERPPRLVTLTQGFYMGIHEVTQGQFEAVMGFNPSWFTTSQVGQDTSNFPVEHVNWFHAIVFSNRLSIRNGRSPAYEMETTTPGVWSANPDLWGDTPTSFDPRWNTTVRIVPGSTGYRLPTEAQWEYAARAKTTMPWNTGDSINITQANFVNGMSTIGRTTTVSSYAPNAWGLYDMHGNVWEWVWDRRGSYATAPQTDPSVDTGWGGWRVVRGGAWNFREQYSRSAFRGFGEPFGDQGYNLGFRVVRPAE